MMKKTVLAVALSIICSLPYTVSAAQEVEYKIINGLRCYETMYNAVPYSLVMQIPLGSKPENVGGFAQDKRGMSSGLPMTFRPSSNPDEVWILDSINDTLKLFNYSGKLIRSISLSKMGFITDFAMNKAGEIAFLNQNSGKIYITDNQGNIKSTLNDFEYALSLEYYNDQELLVKSPLSKGIIRVSTNGERLGLYEADQTLSTYSSKKGIWGLDCFGGTVAKLYVIETGTNNKKVVAEFPFNDFKDVEYKGGAIYGFDSKDNIYFGLTACDSNGIVYRDRIYMCNQDGKVLKQMDVTGMCVRSPDLPRHRVAWPDGRIMTFYSDESDLYSLNAFTFK